MVCQGMTEYYNVSYAHNVAWTARSFLIIFKLIFICIINNKIMQLLLIKINSLGNHDDDSKTMVIVCFHVVYTE